MSEYQLELKQIVDYPRCRIYRQFIGLLMKDKSIRVGGTSGLYHFTVLSCFANFRTSYKRIDGISYTIYPGEWLCRVSELTEWFRTRFQHQALAILRELQDRHLITYTLLGRGRLVKFKIKGWCKYNRVLEYNAPCQKDTGFFFLPISVANELVSAGRCSEMDAMLDLWINTVYNDTQVQGSEVGPVVYMRNGTGSPLIGYAELAQRWGVSKATAGRYLRKMQELDYLSMVAFPGTHGTAIYLKQYLSTMFQISDVMIDKDEVAMSLNIHIQLDEETEDGSVSENSSGVSKSHTEIILQKAAKILAAQGFPCFSCPRLQCKLLPLSDDCTNGLRTYCRLMCGKQKHHISLPVQSEPEEDGLSMEQLSSADDTLDRLLEEQDICMLLQNCKRQYAGTARLGIEAIEWKVKGLSGAEIAKMYGVKPNLVGAWISRAAGRLKQNRDFMQYFDRPVEMDSS